MTTGILHDQSMEKQIEKQMGCMTGFLQLFDRQQILSAKRLNSTKRLPPSLGVDSTQKSIGTPEHTTELQQQQQQELRSGFWPEICSPLPEILVPVESPARTPLQVFEYKEGFKSSWKFKETPRLSLDSRANVDGKGRLYTSEIRTKAAIFPAARCEGSAEATIGEDTEKQHRSPSVIARLMGLEALPDSGGEPLNKAELRRSASESRVSRDLLQYRFIDGNSFRLKQPNVTNAIRDNEAPETNKSKVRTPDSIDLYVRHPKLETLKSPYGGLSASPWKSQQQRKIFFDSRDFFPEPKRTGYFYGEIQKKLKTRGIDEPVNDLETLKQILVALQLKGLLHSQKPAEQIGRRNFVYSRKLFAESPIVVMKPSRSPISNNRTGKAGTESSHSNFRSKAEARRKLNLAGETLPPVRPMRDQPEMGRYLQNERRPRNSRSPDRNEIGAKSPTCLARKRTSNVDTHSRENDSQEQRRSSPVHSPKINTKKVGSDRTRNRKLMPENSSKEKTSNPEEDETSTFSESRVNTPSQLHTELQRSEMEDHKEGRSLLERCDKLLHSIADITASELQPSPVSILDSSFYKDESSPSPVMKRCIDFKDQSVELEDENGSPEISPIRLKSEDKSDDLDFLYISEILRASDCLSENSDVFLLLELQHYKSNSSEVSIRYRKLVFDTISEILDRKRRLPPWKALPGMNSAISKPFLSQIWSEFRRIRERDPADDLVEEICGVLRKDMAGDAIAEWGECPVEMSEAVLDMERLIFKDLVAETIRDLAAFTGKTRALAGRRKLVF